MYYYYINITSQVMYLPVVHFDQDDLGHHGDLGVPSRYI